MALMLDLNPPRLSGAVMLNVYGLPSNAEISERELPARSTLRSCCLPLLGGLQKMRPAQSPQIGEQRKPTERPNVVAMYLIHQKLFVRLDGNRQFFL